MRSEQALASISDHAMRFSASALLIAFSIPPYDRLWTGSGIDHTLGDLIVIPATALSLCASALVSLISRMPPWSRPALNPGILPDPFGSGVAGPRGSLSAATGHADQQTGEENVSWIYPRHRR
jgi:hypothetical protein